MKKLIIEKNNAKHIRNFEDNQIGSIICEAFISDMSGQLEIFLNKYNFKRMHLDKYPIDEAYCVYKINDGEVLTVIPNESALDYYNHNVKVVDIYEFIVAHTAEHGVNSVDEDISMYNDDDILTW